MKELPGGTGTKVVLRSFLVQGSWNYETLIGTGFAFTILPALRAIFANDDAGLRRALTRHSEIFNSHPYLANVAVGAVSRLELERADPRVIARFKSALRGALGALGDQLVWSAWRPAAALLGLLLFLAGAPWWTAIAAFLVVYNVMNVWLRIWGWRVGVRCGLEVARAIREAPLQELARRAAEVGTLLGGAALALAARGAFQDLWAAVVSAVAVSAAIFLGVRTRRVLEVTLGIVVVIGIVSGLAK